MRGDFTRNTFDRTKHFSGVLMQQGRVQVDADLNELGAIQQHRLQSLALDLIGPHGGSANGGVGSLGFGVVDVNTLTPEEKQRLEDARILPLKPGDFLIGKGHYYVDGILCENEDYCSFLHQPDLPDQTELEQGASYLVYLHVWERHITALEDDYIREKALNGPDTASRAKVVWQVRATNKLPNNASLSADATCESIKEHWDAWVKTWRSEHRGMLKAATGDASEADLDNPCITPPDARYRGAENQLYRVEIHTSSGEGKKPTFKWSRDNGSMIFPVVNLAGGEVTLGYLGRDSRHSLEPGQCVELVDDNLALRGEVRPLGKVKAVDRERMMVTVEWPEDPNLPTYDNEEEYRSKHVLLRRWDHTDRESVPGSPSFDAATGTLFIEESDTPDNDNWLTLENGIRISFAKSAGEDHDYQSGDYWLIPARTATGDVEWPWQRDASGDLVMRNNRPVPEKQPPHGVEHHYAPLAVITWAGEEQKVDDCRRQIASVIDSNTDLQVHNLTVGGDLNVMGNVTGITPADIGALAIGEYDLRRTTWGDVTFLPGDGDGAEREIPFDFQPKLIFVHGYCNANIPQSRISLGGMVWSFADARGNTVINLCSGISMQILSSRMWFMSSVVEPGLCFARFTEELPQTQVTEIRVEIITWSPFTVILHKTIPDGDVALTNFSVYLSVYGFG